MKHVFFHILVTTAFSMLALTGGCGVDRNVEKMTENTDRMAAQLEQDQAYIRSLTESIAAMNRSINTLAMSLMSLESMSSTAFDLVVNKIFVAQPPATTPDIDDVLKDTPPPTEDDPK